LETLANLDESGVMKVYEFFKYHALAPHTGPNTVPMYTGDDIIEYPFNLTEHPLWWSTFDEQYVKAWVYGSCEDWMHTYMHTSESPYSLEHTLVMPFCHPQAYPNPDPFGPFNGPYSMRARCIGDKHVHNVVFDYAKEYFTNYNEIGKIALLSFMEAHEGSLEVISQVDEDLSNFLMSPTIHAELNNTFVFVVADHGNHMSPFFLWTKNGIIENRLPTLFILTPKWFSERYPELAENLDVNQNRLVTAHDLYNTFIQLHDLPEFKQNVNYSANMEAIKGLFRSIPEDRNCADALVPDIMCICKK